MNRNGNKTVNKIIILFVAAMIAAAVSCTREIVSYTLDEIEEEISDTEEEIDGLEEEISGMESAKDELEDYLSGLNEKYSSVLDEMDDLEMRIDVKQAEVDTAQAELDEALAVQEEQYDAMVERIQYMYENPPQTFLEILLTEGNLADALEQYSYSQEMTEYDQEKLEEYEAQTAVVEEKTTALEAELSELEDLKSDLEAEYDEILTLQAEAEAQVAEYVTAIAESSEELEAYEDALDELLREKEELETELEEEKENEITASLGTDYTAERSDGLEYVTYDAYDATEYEITCLAVIIYCEAGNQSYEGQLAVGAVIMNRIRDSRFAQNDIISVIRAAGQFSPVTSGRFDLILSSGLSQVPESCYAAAREAASGVSPVGSRTFFRAYNGNSNLSGLVIGGHIFSHTWNYSSG